MICHEVAFEYTYNNSRTVNCIYEYSVITYQWVEMYNIPTVYYYYSELPNFGKLYPVSGVTEDPQTPRCGGPLIIGLYLV